VPFLLTAAALTLLYRIVPNRYVQLRHALLGGLIAGLLFELVKRGFGLYVARMPTYTAVYGAFAAVPIFLIWLYLSWFVVIYGATITAMLPGYRIVLRGERRAGESLLEAVALLEMLLAAHRAGGAMPLHELARSTAVAPEVADRLLLHMQARGWVAKTGADRWMLARDSEEIRLVDLAQAYVLDPATAGALALRWPAFATLDQSLDALSRNGNPSLRELLATPATSPAA
jgi:membrane protein